MQAEGTPKEKAIPGIWDNQIIHFIGLIFLIVIVWCLWAKIEKPNPIFFWSAIAVPVLHQIYVWLSWRIELNSSGVTKSIGFKAYLIFFFILFAGRAISIICIAYLDMNSLGFDPLPRFAIAGLLLLPALYLTYSVKKYFAFTRAAGGDHFYQKYRDLPIVQKGIFRFSSNSMYVFGFMMLWAIAIGFNSKAALIVAAFNHAYIWVHYFVTEKPDMEYLVLGQIG